MIGASMQGARRHGVGRWGGWLVASASFACAQPERPGPAAAVVVIPPPVASPAVLESPPEPEPAADTRVRERWVGRGEQDDGQVWPMTLELRGFDQSPCAAVTYPKYEGGDIACAGVWVCDAQRSTARHLFGVERILEGMQRCIEGCLFDADLDAGVIEFDCSHAGVMARVEIHRAE